MARGHYMIDGDESSNSCHEHVPATTILESEKIVNNKEEEEKVEHLESIEYLERIEPPSTPNLSNDKEISIEAHSFITIPFETLHEPQALVLQCLKEPFMINLPRIYAHKVTNLGIIFLRRSFEASK
jgi:hypothetical protein